jgi:hypothetical protein
MKRLIALVVLAVVGFYLVWPAWSGYRIAAALQSRDAGLLESKIDFPSVRQGLRPIVEAEVGREFEKQAGQGLGALLSGDFKKDLVPKLVDMVLDKVITGENVIRLAREGGDLGGGVQKILMEQIAKSGGIPGLPGLPGLGGGSGSGGVRLPGGLGGVLGGGSGGVPGLSGGIPGFGGAPTPAATPPAPTAAPTSAAVAAKPSYGVSNIKRFSMVGPLGYSVSVGRDAAAPKPDATITMRFTGFDWKITDIVPHLP